MPTSWDDLLDIAEKIQDEHLGGGGFQRIFVWSFFQPRKFGGRRRTLFSFEKPRKKGAKKCPGIALSSLESHICGKNIPTTPTEPRNFFLGCLG